MRIETAKVLLDYRPQIAKFINYDAYGNDTLFNSTLATKMADLFDDYKALSSDSIYNFVLDDIIDDINNYKNMTIEDFIYIIVTETDYVTP